MKTELVLWLIRFIGLPIYYSFVIYYIFRLHCNSSGYSDIQQSLRDGQIENLESQIVSLTEQRTAYIKEIEEKEAEIADRTQKD